MVAAGASPDDVVVANVNGRPVWGSCVSIQAKRDPKLTRAQALDQCISFELLAQEAESRNLATDSEVILETRTALVTSLVDRFDSQYRDEPASLAPKIDQILAVDGPRFARPVMRQSSHALIKVAATAPEPLQRRAQDLAAQLHAKLANETGLLPQHFEAIAKTIEVDAPLERVIESIPPVPRERSGLDEGFTAALFAIPEVGRVSPVTKTPFGYHVILFADEIPPGSLTREMVLLGLRRELFIDWVGGLMKNVDTEIHPELLGADAQEPPS